MNRYTQLLAFLLTACGGSITLPGPDADLTDTTPPPDASEKDAGDAKEAEVEACGWRCQPFQGQDLYVDTCTGRACPGTGGCASHPVPNPCADGGP